jgi:uncharacterized protein YjaG (DUF416 family)
MYEKETVETLKRVTGLELADLDYIAKLELSCVCKTREIENLEDDLTEIRNKVYLTVEKEYELAGKGSQIAKDLSNAEKREIEVSKRLKNDNKFMNFAVQSKQLKNERVIMELTRDSLKRKHERNCFGKELAEG